jgi:hypothetical protein
MTYTFARIKVHPKLDLTAWYLVITREMVDLTMDMHKSAAISMFLKFHRDPHLFDQKTWQPTSDHSQFFNPVKLSAGWLQTAMKGLGQFGTIYMGTAHGLLFGEKVDVLETREGQSFDDWPKDDPKDGVTITITSWRGGDHFYLSASNNQVFAKPKFDTLDEAMAEARKYAFEKNISYKPNYRSFVEGD